MKAKYIGSTHGGQGRKERWECPKCREDSAQPECRFNLSKKKTGGKHNCRFCGIELELEKNE